MTAAELVEHIALLPADEQWSVCKFAYWAQRLWLLDLVGAPPGKVQVNDLFDDEELAKMLPGERVLAYRLMADNTLEKFRAFDRDTNEGNAP